MKQWLIDTIKTREKNPKNYSSDYSRGELRGYKEALKQLKAKSWLNLLFFEVLIWALTLRDYKLKEKLGTKKAPY